MKKSFSIAFCIALLAAPAALGQGRVKETPLDDLPAVDSNRAQPNTRGEPPAPPPIPRAPRTITRAPSADDDAPFTRETPPPAPASRTSPPARLHDPAPSRADPTPRYERPAARYEEPPPRTADPPRVSDSPRRADTARRRAEPPPVRSSFYSNCTQQCHLSCEASFEACNGDSSPAKVECVRKLESCRTERCACRLE